MKKFYSWSKQISYCLLLILIGQKGTAQNTCPPNIDFEAGNFSNWQCYTGSTTSAGCTPGSNSVTATPSAPIPGRHTIITPAAAANDPFGNFPMCPDGNNVARLGFVGQTGAQIERLSYDITIPATATAYSLTYKYAVVYQDPNHCEPNQPHFEAKVFDVTTGQYINCASFEYYATPGQNGFLLSPNTSQGTVYYKTWTSVTFILSDYIGHNIRVEFTNADCTQSGHWAYCYVDVVNNCSAPVLGGQFCVGATTTSLTAPFGYAQYNWFNAGYGTPISTSQTLTLTPPPTAPQTTYNVEVIPIPGFGCRDTIPVTVKPFPVVPADAGVDRVNCSGGNQTVAPIGTAAQPGYTYSWSPTAGLSDPNIAQPVATPTSNTNYILTVTDVATGCTKKDTVTVNVAPPITPTFTINNANQCLAGNNYQFTATASNPTGLTYSWYFGDSPQGTSNQQNPSYVYTAPGTYTVKLIMSSSTGCVDSSSQTVVVSPSPLADAGPDKLLCGGSSSSTVIGTPAVLGSTYSWSPATGLSSATAAQPTASPSASTQYILTVTGTGGCIKKDTVNVNVAPSITPAFTVNTANQCLLGNNYQFTSSASNPSGLTYTWTFGDSPMGSSTQQNPSYQYTTPGTYTVKLVVSASGGSCKDSSTQTVVVNPTPVASAGPDRLICGGSTQAVTIGSPAQGSNTYSWSPSTGLSSATAAQPTITVGNPSSIQTTNYILSVTAPGGCVTKDTVVVTIYPTITGVFTVNTASQCLNNNSFQFNTNNPAGTTYAWDFGVAGQTSNQQNPTHVYTSPGTYTVKLVVSNANGCKDSTTQTMTVSAMPVANAGTDLTLCGGSAASQTIGSPAVAGNTYSWTPSTGLSSATAAQPTVTPGNPTSLQTTNYILTVTAAGGCYVKDTVSVTVTPTLTGVFTVNAASQCLASNNFQFNTNNPAGTTYAWDFGVAGQTSNQQNPSHSYTAAGTYTVKLVVSNANGCKDSSTQNVSVNLTPVADAGTDQMLCGGTNGSVTIGTPALAGYSYSWSPSAGLNNPTAAQPVASPSSTTDYIVTVTGAGGCVKKDTVKVVVTQTLSAAFNVNNSTQCITGNNFQFTMANPIGGLNYLWTFGDAANGTSTLQNPTYQYAAAGAYTVKVVISTPNGCKDSSSKQVTINNLPTGTISSTETNICEGTPVVLTATGTANTYRWYKNGTLVATTSTNTYNATQPGVYTFDLNNGCTNAGTGSVTLTLTKKPTVDWSYSTMCLGYPTTFTDNSNVSGSLPVNYSWDFGTNTLPGSNQPSPTVTYGDAGTYNVQFTVTPQSCPQLATTLQKNVVIKGPTPGIMYTEKAALENIPLQLQARNFGVDYSWSPGTNLNLTDIMSPVFQGMTDQLYTITIKDNLGCVTVDTQQVRVYKEVNIYVPKAFTPNNDGLNDYMYPFTVGIKEIKFFRIINRWGVVVYQAKTDLPGWDGKYKGAAQPMDGYVWEIQAIDFFGKSHVRHGSFTLIR